MSDPQASPRPAPDGTDEHVAIRDVVDPATVRRAPRYGRFLWAGAFAGLLLGLALSLYLVGTEEARGLMKPGVYVTALTAFVMTVTTILAGGLAVILDRRSDAKR